MMKVRGLSHFITEIRARSDSCNFAEKDRMMRDKIVFSMIGKLQALLLREDDLNLSKAVKVCRAFEQLNKHVKEIRDTKEQHVHKVSPNIPENRSKKKRISIQYRLCESSKFGVTPRKIHEETRNYTKQAKVLYFCGYNHEMQKEKCPAWGKVCSACKGRNHFKARCKKVHSLEREKKMIPTMITG